MINFNTIRTMLFTPGNRPDRFAKAETTGADGMIIDLEDAVSLPDKDKAREVVVEYLKNSAKKTSFLQCLRINSPKTQAGINDLAAILQSGITPDAIVIPKTEFPAELIILDSLFSSKSIPYLALIETALGLKNAADIATASPNVKALCFGGADFAADLGAELVWEPMLNARSALVRAAAIGGIAVLDVPYLHLKDIDDSGILEETRRVKALGFTGKLAIHPKHIKPILDTFTPSEDEAKRAQRIVDAYNAAKGNVCEIDGKMIDVPVIRSAQRILELAELKS